VCGLQCNDDSYKCEQLRSTGGNIINFQKLASYNYEYITYKFKYKYEYLKYEYQYQYQYWKFVLVLEYEYKYQVIHLCLQIPKVSKTELTSWLITYQDGLPTQRISPISVLTGPNVD